MSENQKQSPKTQAHSGTKKNHAGKWTKNSNSGHPTAENKHKGHFNGYSKQHTSECSEKPAGFLKKTSENGNRHPFEQGTGRITSRMTRFDAKLPSKTNHSEGEARKADFRNSNPAGLNQKPHLFGKQRTFEQGTGRPSSVVRQQTVEVTLSRKAAYQVLMEVFGRSAYASLSLARHFHDADQLKMKEEDRRLVSNLVYGVIENTGRLDWVIDRFLHAPLDDLRQRVILRLGAYQMLFLDRVPDNAAVNESVNLCKQEKMEMSAGFINAVLRSIGREKDKLTWPLKSDNPAKYVSIMSSTPLWLVQKLNEDYGEEQTERMLLENKETRGVVVRPNFTRTSDGEMEKILTQKEWLWEKGIVPHAYRVLGANVASSHEFLSGMISIQGQSSMLSAMAMDAKLGQKLLDACSAPGGKAAYLCERMQLSGRVYAWELHETRLTLLGGIKKRLALDNLRPALYDASILREDWIETLDGVLLDAPCSGTGVMAQKPDIKNRIREEDVPSITETQKKLLNTVCRYVKRGGTFVYSTCSVLKDENEKQIRLFLEAHPEFEVIPLPDSVPQEIRSLQSEFGLQLLSGELGLEGFFICRMRRI